MMIFALSDSAAFGKRIAAHLGVPLSAHEERNFEDGEHKIRPLISVRNRSVFVVQGLHGGPDASANDKLCKLLFFISTLKNNGASRVTALVPYLAYSRKDRQTKSRDPVTTQYVARLFEAAGLDSLVTLDVHNIAAFQNAFRCTTVHLDTRQLFCQHILPALGERPVAIVSPDPGGVKRAQLFREMLEMRIGRTAGQAFLDKRRSAGVVSGELLVGEVEGATAVIIDDLISSGGTMARAASALRDHGAAGIICCAAHGLFTGAAEQTLAASAIDRIVITDAVPPFRLDADFAARRIETVSAAPLFARTIQCLENGGSITELLEGGSASHA